MNWITLKDGDTLDSISESCGLPACMIMRANRLLSPAWLLTGREVLIPDGDFCNRDRGQCPIIAMRCSAKAADADNTIIIDDDMDVSSISRTYKLPERLIYKACGLKCGQVPSGMAITLPIYEFKTKLIVVQPLENLTDIATKYGCDADEIYSMNQLDSPIMPGMRLIIPDYQV